MGTILCATRGGPASHRAQDAAIAVAKQEGKLLVFLYVVDTSFIDKTERAVRPAVVAEEMSRMGEFLLAMAQERAKAREVLAEARIRQGEFKEQLQEAIRSEWADVAILGQPADEASAFKLAALEAIAAAVQEETGVEVRIV